MKKVVKLVDISSELRSRSIARKLFSDLAKERSDSSLIELDFDNVTMMSRSFADEIFEFISHVGEEYVNFANASTNISLTLKIVKKNRSCKRHFTVSGNTESFDDIDSLRNFLLSF